MAKQETNSRPTEVASYIDDKTKKMLEDIEEAETQLDDFISVCKDRFKQSSEPSYAITLAKMFELKMDTFKKRADLLKLLSTDRGIDINAGKKTVSQFSFNDILSGQSINGISMSGPMPQSTLPGFSTHARDFKEVNAEMTFELVDPNEVEVESEEIGGHASINRSITKLMDNDTTEK